MAFGTEVASLDADCGGTSSDVVTTIGTCSVECLPGFFDCDNNPSNGCETKSIIGCEFVDASNDITDASSEPTTPHRIATLDSPSGLVVCAGRELVLDGLTLRAINSATLANDVVALLPELPLDGLACDGAYAYWLTPSTGDGGPNGALYAVALSGGTPEAIALNVDTRIGIDTNDTGVLFMTSSGVATITDAGVTPWMPATSSTAYKAFTSNSTATWSLDQASILRRDDLDAAVSSAIDDAGTPTALVTASNGPFIARHAAIADGGVAYDEIEQVIEDDAGTSSLALIGDVKPIVTASVGLVALVASDDTLYALGPPTVNVLATTSDHIVDVAVDDTWAVWTTHGEGQSAPGLWRMKLP